MQVTLCSPPCKKTCKCRRKIIPFQEALVYTTQVSKHWFSDFDLILIIIMLQYQYITGFLLWCKYTQSFHQESLSPFFHNSSINFCRISLFKWTYLPKRLCSWAKPMAWMNSWTITLSWIQPSPNLSGCPGGPDLPPIYPTWELHTPGSPFITLT